MSRSARTTIAAMVCVAANASAGQALIPVGPQPATDWAAGLLIDAAADAPWVGRMCAHPDGDRIALGRIGPGSGTWFRAREMHTATGAVFERGTRTVPDPDSVAYDIAGSFAPAGSILVGGVHGIFAVAPSNTVSLAIAPSQWISNPEDLRFDRDGNLIVASYSANALVRVDRNTGSQTPLHIFDAGILQFDVARDGSFRVIDPTGGVRTIAADGADRGAAGPRYCTGIAASPGGIWPEGVYTCDMTTGELLRIDERGRSHRLFTDVFTPITPEPGQILPPAVELAFTPNGTLYIGVPEEGLIYRVAADTCFRMDTNGNGTLTPADFNFWILCFVRGDMRADINGDGMLLADDFYAWINGWYTCERQASARAVRAAQRLKQLGSRTR